MPRLVSKLKFDSKLIALFESTKIIVYDRECQNETDIDVSSI